MRNPEANDLSRFIYVSKIAITVPFNPKTKESHRFPLMFGTERVPEAQYLVVGITTDEDEAYVLRDLRFAVTDSIINYRASGRPPK